MIRIYQAQDLPQAQLIIDLLAHNQIAAFMQNINAQSAMGEVPFTHAYPEIWLTNNTNIDRAKALIKDFERPVSDEQWICKSCLELSPVTFDFCWSCAQLREKNG